MGEIIDCPQGFPNGSPPNSQAPRRWGQVTEERRTGRKVSDSSRQKKICGSRASDILNKRVADFGERFQTRIGPDRASHGTNRQVGKTATGIRTYQRSYPDQSSPPWRQQRWARCPGLRYRSEQLWVPCAARSLNRSRVVARERHMHIPSWGSSQSSRAPAHGRLGSWGEGRSNSQRSPASGVLA